MVEEIGAIETKKEEIISSTDIEKRKKQIIHFLKEKTNWIFYSFLSLILIISVYIRTRPMAINPATGNPKLWDITTNSWTLGPDLDPFLFLRWAKYIVEHGKLFIIDTMRSVPLADICSGITCSQINTASEMKLLPYMISSLSNILSFLNKEITVTYAAIIFPVIMAVLTGIAFFLFTRKVFYKEDKKTANIIALIATLFFILMPSLLPRSIAGIPEKESAAFFFIFMAFYFFLEAHTSEKISKGVMFSILAGISTALLGLTWGAVVFIFITIAIAVFISFLFGKLDGKRLLFYSIWLITSALTMIPFSTRYTLTNLVTSVSTGLAFMMFFIFIIDFLIFKKKVFKINEKLEKIKLPHQIISLILASVVLVILSSIFFGISFLPEMIKAIISDTIKPMATDRFGVTVAENKQPYFLGDWTGEFGPIIFNIPLYFWLFFVGAVFLFNYMIKSLEKKEKIILVGGYILFLLGLIFSKYSSNSILNGESGLSILVYVGGVLLFLVSFGYVYYQRYKERKVSIFSEINFSYILYFILLTMMIIAARGAVRLVMVLGAVSPIAVAFLIVKLSKNYLKEKEEGKKLFMGITIAIILLASLFTAWTYYQNDISMAENYAPNIYTQEWQKAMAWVRENTPLTAVFAHWWDYGYWVQSMGERATILDGGNALGYWNHLMGRLVLTGSNEREALNFLYAHNATHLLIDSTDIGKYAAFSSIGSDANYDRYSWIPNIFIDNTQTRETSNGTTYVYPIGTPIDQDLILQKDGKEILLPRKKAAVAAVTINEDFKKNIVGAEVFFFYNGQQYSMPLRYVHVKDKLYDFKTGLNAGIFIFPLLQNDNGQLSVDDKGAAFYLGERTINSGIARYYLFNEESQYIKLAHTESDLLIDNLKQQGLDVGEFAYYNGLRGPIKIWSITYPSGIQLNESYLSTDYPKEFTNVNPNEY